MHKNNFSGIGLYDNDARSYLILEIKLLHDGIETLALKWTLE